MSTGDAVQIDALGRNKHMNNRRRCPDEWGVHVVRLTLQRLGGRERNAGLLAGGAAPHCSGIHATEFLCVFKEIRGG